MPTPREEFFDNCVPESERKAYEQLINDVERLAESLGDARPEVESELGSPLAGLRLRLRFAFADRKGCSLQLQHPKLKGGVQPVSILWAFPTRVDQAHASNRVAVPLKYMKDEGIDPKYVEAFSEELQKSEFETTREGLKTNMAGHPEGISRIFGWESNRRIVVAALRALIERIESK